MRLRNGWLRLGRVLLALVVVSACSSDELTNEDIYTSIEDSIVFIKAPDDSSSASGVVVEGGWILTSAHVVDRHQSMMVGRSDGVELGLHEVRAVDWSFDLALIGPVDDPGLSPIIVGDSSALPLGSRVLLAGFPDEDSVLPTPTLTEGIISRRRTLAIGDYPFLQVDATIAPGQSGGALVNSRGELVGISGIEFGAGEFGLAFASAGLAPRIEAMKAADYSNVPQSEPVSTLADQVGPLRNYGFTVEVGELGSVDILVTSTADVWVDIQTLGASTVSKVEEPLDPFRAAGIGGQHFIDDLAAGGEEVIATLDPGTYVVMVGTTGSSLSDIEINSANDLRPFIDVEEGAELPTNEVVEGGFDWVRDTDQWNLPLEAGQEVALTVDGLSDTVVVVRLEDEVITSSDDDGLGVFGTGSTTTFVAETAGDYVVEVGTFDQTPWGYFIEAATTG